MDFLTFLKIVIFCLPLPIAVAVAWRCRKRGKHFSYCLVYVLPFLLPVVSYIIQSSLDIDLLFQILGREVEVWFMMPYALSVATCGAIMLMGKISPSVRLSCGALSLPELFCLHAGVAGLGLFFSFFLSLVAGSDLRL